MITTHYYLHIIVCSMLMLQLSAYCLSVQGFISGDFTEIAIAPGIRMIHPFQQYQFLSKRQISLFSLPTRIEFFEKPVNVLGISSGSTSNKASSSTSRMYPLTFSELAFIFGQSTSGSNSSSSSSSS